MADGRPLDPAIVEDLLGALIVLKPDGEILSWGKGASALLGHTEKEVLHRSVFDLVLPEKIQRFRETLGSGRPLQSTLRHKDGTSVPVDVSVRSFRDEANGEVRALSVRDISHLKAPEEKLLGREERHRVLFDSHPYPLWVFDEASHRFLDVNQAALDQYGYSREEFLSMTIEEIRPVEDLARLQEWFETHDRGRHKAGVWRHVTKGGKAIDVEISSHTVQLEGRNARLVVAVDVTERRRLEAQLLQAQRLEAVGLLAGGIAHDFNNLLGVIMGYTDLLKRELGAGHPSELHADRIRQAAERATNLTRQLLAFSRKQVLQPRKLDLNDVVIEIETLLRRLIGEDIQLICLPGTALGPVSVDPGQLEQVIVNLAVNARDAMPEGGKLIIETTNSELDEAYADTHTGVEPGRYVLLSVSDTGQGMDEATRARAFEPFFTTKAPGRGTGLGLATVYGIVKQSGGHINLYSEVGRGTTVKMYLPHAEGVAEKKTAEKPSPPASGHETILLAEDEGELRAMIREILEAEGYSVLEGSTPEEAIEMGLNYPGPIHLLLTDVVMPRIGGAKVAAQVTARHPDLLVVYMSGYTDEAILHHGILESDVEFLQKPFTSEALLRTLRRVLDAQPRKELT